MNPQKQCEEIYYASDVCDKSLTFGCWVESSESRNYVHQHRLTRDLDRAMFFKVIGHPPKLNDWLRLMEKKEPDYHLSFEGQIMQYNPETGSLHLTGIWFNMNTGQPATEKDWEQLLEIIK